MSESHSLLPREVTALVSHIELNQAGWWDKTLQRLILASVWLMEKSTAKDEISRMLKEDWNLTVNPEKLESVLNSLMDEESLIRVSNDVYRIPEEKRKIFEREIDATEKAENNAREYFCSLVADSCPNLDSQEVWKDFEYILFTPMVRDFGANTYRLIVGERIAPDDSYTGHFLTKFEPRYRGALKAVVANFLDPKREDVRNYAMRLLHAHFCIEASGLSGEVLDKLKSITSKQTKFRLFVDTNFLFSFLGLHENPSNASATELKELLFNLKDKFQIDLRITPKTIDEAKKVIWANKEQVSRVPMTDNFSGAALQVGISGISARFFSERKERGGQLTADDWFDPYLNDFVLMARAAGIELFNEKLDEYGTREDVVDDIVSLMNYEKNSLPEGRRKSYEKVAHDVILWHLIKDKRPAYVESPLDAQDWILTVDFRLIRFDEHKLKTSESNIPLCLHPTSLIQLLQFWVPRTQEFEEAVLGGLRLPFLFQEFDAKAERISLDIIKQLGRFEGSETIPQETLVNVIMNDSLRSRINTGQPEREEIDLVRDALVEEVRLQAQQKEAKSKELEATLKSKEAAFVSLQKQATAKDKTVAELSRQLNEEKQNNLALLKYLGLLGCMIALSFAVVWLVDLLFPFPQSTPKSILIRSAVGIFAFISLHWLFEFIKFHNQKMKQLWLFTKVKKFRKWLWGPILGGLILGVLGDVIWSIMDL